MEPDESNIESDSSTTAIDSTDDFLPESQVKMRRSIRGNTKISNAGLL